MHIHHCDIAEHDWQCSDDNCECICDLPMEAHDHSDCPVELRACPEHIAEDEAQMVEAMQDKDSVPDLAFDETQGTVADCQCGCGELDASQFVGWCLHCNHVYSKWNLLIQDQHFATHCPGVPEQTRQDAQAALAKRGMEGG